MDEDAVGGVGGLAETKSDGIAATDDCRRSVKLPHRIQDRLTIIAV